MTSSDPPEPAELFNAQGAGSRVGVSSGRIRQIAYDRSVHIDRPPARRTPSGQAILLLPGQKVDGAWVFTREDLDEFIRKRQDQGLQSGTLSSKAQVRRLFRPAVDNDSAPAGDVTVEVAELTNRLRSALGRLQWVEGRLNSVESRLQESETDQERRRPRAVESRRAAEEADSRATEHLLAAMQEMQKRDRHRRDEVDSLYDRLREDTHGSGGESR